MLRLPAALACAVLFSAPAFSCDITLPLREGMFAAVAAPVDNLTGLPGGAGAFEYLDETHLDTIHLTHSGKTFDWTASNTAATCAARLGAARSCRVIADGDRRFGRLTLVRETQDGVEQLRYRLLLVDGRRHLRLFARPASSEAEAACNLMESLAAFERAWMGG